PNTPPPNQFPNNARSPSIHHDSLITTREPTPIRSPPPQGALSLYRRNALHIGLQLDCKFHGIRQGQYLTTFTVSAKNVGQVLHEFEQVTLRVRAIKDEPFAVFRRPDPRKQREDECARRVAFPHEVLRANLVPWNFVFIEPGVTQDLTLTTMIPADCSYLLAHVMFEYKEYWPHTAEAVFAVPAGFLRSDDAVAVESGTILNETTTN
ncbi:hypothetical protein AAHH97_19995, partial [Mycolicibacterium elephantis]|uniref:hypothetical protein n=1 Tax=Mycolicibacterium elephantis TaxID=81858 RepID=UPI003A8B1B90